MRRSPVRYAGPNVTDFEPLYNAGLLSWFRQRGSLPDIHTNNLFVERIIEPEAFDPRVGGRLMAKLFRFNLIKKAQVLQKIGADNKVPELWCSHVSWTAPRIRRFIEDADQKQADYLSRYFVLAAASGATGYAAARYALRGLTAALRLDLRGTGIGVSEVVPGKVSSRYFVNNPGAEARIPALARVIPTVTPQDVAARIVEAVERERDEVVFPWQLRAFDLAGRWFPGLTGYLTWRTGTHR